MLRIQLCPQSELENRYWWAVDASTLVLAGAATWFAAELTLNSIRKDIDHFNQTADRWSLQTKELQPAVKKFNSLDHDIQLLNRKLAAIRSITTNHREKIQPIVVADQLQTLRPDGLWFHSAAYNEDKSIKLKGAANDSLTISEFILGLRETMNPKTISTDIRTQTGFDNISVNEIKDEAKDPGYADLSHILLFEAKANVREKKRPVTVNPVAGPIAQPLEAKVF